MVGLSHLESIQRGYAKMLSEFRSWCYADIQEVMHWKKRPIKDSMRVVEGRLIDDAEQMLERWRTHEEQGVRGSFSPLPVILYAFESSPTLPDASQLRGVTEWRSVVLPNDPQNRVVQMRTMPITIRTQVAIFCANPHSAISIASQLVNYLTIEKSRTLDVLFDFGGNIKDTWQYKVIDNNLFPSKVPLQEQNLTIITVDIPITGLVPQIVGLGGDNDGNITGTTDAQVRSAIVIEADALDVDTSIKMRHTADITTEVITDTRIE